VSVDPPPDAPPVDPPPVDPLSLDVPEGLDEPGSPGEPAAPGAPGAPAGPEGPAEPVAPAGPGDGTTTVEPELLGAGVFTVTCVDDGLLAAVVWLGPNQKK
jgi:hypothetical protein